MDGNAHAVSLRNNVENQKVRFGSTARIRTIESVMRTIERVVTRNKRKRTVALRPKGMKSDYNDWEGIVGNGQTVSGLQMASKSFIIICDVEPGFALCAPGESG